VKKPTQNAVFPPLTPNQVNPKLLWRLWSLYSNFEWTKVKLATFSQRWPESLFQTPTPLLSQNFWIWVGILIRLFLKFENPTPVQTPATIIDPTVIYPCFYLRNDRTDSCYWRNGKVTPIRSYFAVFGQSECVYFTINENSNKNVYIKNLAPMLYK